MGQSRYWRAEDRSKYLQHYGRGFLDGANPGSGRYRYGSGKYAYQRSNDIRATVKKLQDAGMTETQIVKHLGLKSTFQLRAMKAIQKAEVRRNQEDFARKLKEKGMSTTAIAERMFGDKKKESYVRLLLDDALKERNAVLKGTTDMLKQELEEHPYLDVGLGSNIRMGITETKLKTALATLEEEGGYKVRSIQVEQAGTAPGQKTTIKVLTKDDVPTKEIYDNMDQIHVPKTHSEDGGDTFDKIEPIKSIDSSRVMVNYAETGGTDKDGVMEIRRGCADLDLGAAHYAQVRIGVDGTHYLKGMAVYADDTSNWPAGVDIKFNTNKHEGTPMLGEKDHSVLKPMKADADNPFGATIRTDDELILVQRHYTDQNGNRQLSALNVVNEEGNWASWSKTIASQMLDKQPASLAKQQLDLTYGIQKANFDEIMSLTNPTVKRKLLEDFADRCDAAAVDLKAHGFPGQASHVILPINSLKDNQIYAPQYENGTEVVLIRYPHAGIFEIPRLTVNNNNAEGKATLGKSIDGVGINSHVAQHLSGADFDGDTVLVIPDNQGRIQTQKYLEELKNFEPKEAYRGYEGMKKMTEQEKGREMGVVTNLITDMSMQKAPVQDMVKAVKHSMVVIDAYKHGLDWRRSEKENDIEELKAKYQRHEDGTYGGASSLFSRASSETTVFARKELSPDPVTGKRRYLYTDEYYLKGKLKGVTKKDGGEVNLYEDKKAGKLYYLKKDEATGKNSKIYVNEDQVTVKKVKRTQSSTKMAEAEDATTLISAANTPVERYYAAYANNMKALANQARKEMLITGNLKYDPTAAKTYKAEVESLERKLRKAEANAPLERQAQIMTNVEMKSRIKANPDMSKDDIKKMKGRVLQKSRIRCGAVKERVDFTDNEWKAIQAGAVHDSFLRKLLNNADMKTVKVKAMPRTSTGLTSGKLARAESMKARGYTLSEIADALGVSKSTVENALK